MASEVNDNDQHADGAKADIKDKSEEKALISPKQVQIIDPVDAANSLGKCKEPPSQRMALKTYPRRWVVLAVVALLNNLNAVLWIGFSPISNHVDIYYGKDSSVYFSAIYIFVTIPVGIFAMWAGGHFGLRWSILTAAWATGVGASVRLISSFFPDPILWLRFPVGITGQGIAALSYPFIMFLPTKVAAAWFPDNERTLATTIGVMANPLGVLLTNLISPRIVESCLDIQTLNILLAVPSIILTAIATIAVNRSEPKLPPTVSAGQQSFPFIRGIKECFTNAQYLVLLLVLGGGIGMFNCLYTLMQQLLCPSGYSNVFSGLTSALLITGGLVGATGAGIFVDKTKLYEETMKVAMALAVVFGLTFLQLSLHTNLEVFILLSCFVFGVFGLAAYPVGLQLSAECTFPVSETTSTGIVVLSGQVQTILYLTIMKSFTKPLQPSHRQNEVCTLAKVAAVEHLANPPTCGHGSAENVDNTVEPLDFTMSVIVMSVIATLIVLILVLLFRPKLRRMEVEQGIRLVGAEDKEKGNEMVDGKLKLKSGSSAKKNTKGCQKGEEEEAVFAVHAEKLDLELAERPPAGEPQKAEEAAKEEVGQTGNK